MKLLPFKLPLYVHRNRSNLMNRLDPLLQRVKGTQLRKWRLSRPTSSELLLVSRPNDYIKTYVADSVNPAQLLLITIISYETFFRHSSTAISPEIKSLFVLLDTMGDGYR